jgi:predicted nucleic acid-binding protein
LSESDVDAFVNTLISIAEPVDIHFLWRPQLRDAGDEMVLETAVNGQAAVLVAFNRRDYGMAPRFFGIEVLLPREALKRI